MLARTERVRNAFPIAVGRNIPRAGSSAARGCKYHQGRQQAQECAEQQLLGASPTAKHATALLVHDLLLRTENPWRRLWKKSCTNLQRSRPHRVRGPQGCGQVRKQRDWPRKRDPRKGRRLKERHGHWQGKARLKAGHSGHLAPFWAWPAADKLLIWRNVKNLSGLGQPLINCSYGAMSKQPAWLEMQRSGHLAPYRAWP